QRGESIHDRRRAARAGLRQSPVECGGRRAGGQRPEARERAAAKWIVAVSPAQRWTDGLARRTRARVRDLLFDEAWKYGNRLGAESAHRRRARRLDLAAERTVPGYMGGGHPTATLVSRAQGASV